MDHPLKLLVFAHIPPPHHGQSYMIKLMLDGFGGDARRRRAPGPDGAASPLECYHVNARFSSGMEDIGEIRWGKLLLLLRYCLEAIWCRFRYGVKTFYYVPAPGKRAAVYRDWLVLLLCRPFFPKMIFHWHAAGLSDWVSREGNWFERAVTRLALGRGESGIALAIPGMRDALWFDTRRVDIVPNGIPDPCPDCEERLLPRRLDPARRPRQIFYLAHCTREKGVFDTLEALALYNARHPQEPLKLIIAGAFLDESEEVEFRERIARADLAGAVEYAGFVSGERKRQLLEESDALSFPTYYGAEGQPVNLIEALAFGLPVVTTRWRGIPEILPAGYPFCVPPRDPAALADALEKLRDCRPGAELRAQFVAKFTLESHLRCLARTIVEGACGETA